jgi:hypothetical protein
MVSGALLVLGTAAILVGTTAALRVRARERAAWEAEAREAARRAEVGEAARRGEAGDHQAAAADQAAAILEAVAMVAARVSRVEALVKDLRAELAMAKEPARATALASMATTATAITAGTTDGEANT